MSKTHGVDMIIWVCDGCRDFILDGEADTAPGWMDDLFRPQVKDSGEPYIHISTTPCEWCGTQIAGGRHSMRVLAGGWKR